MHLITKCKGRIIIPASTQEHMRAHPESWQLLPEAVGRLDLPKDGSELSIEFDFGRIIGRSGCIETPRIGFNQVSFFAMRLARAFPSRVVMGEDGPEIRHMTIKAVPAPHERVHSYQLITAYIGNLAPSEPWHLEQMSFEDFQESMDFWTTHALTYNPVTMSHPFPSTWTQVLRATPTAVIKK